MQNSCGKRVVFNGWRIPGNRRDESRFFRLFGNPFFLVLEIDFCSLQAFFFHSDQ